jgi:hypothetical protein
MKILVRAATALGRSARKQRNRFGTEITHCRTGTGGMTRSTRCAADCAIRRPLQEGQTPRPLHEKATTKPCPHEAQRALPNPKQRMPQFLVPPTNWGELAQADDDPAIFQTSSDELPVVDIRSL